MTRLLSIFLLAGLLAAPAAAQTPVVLDPTKNLAVAWDPSTDSEDTRPTGYTFETFAETQTGVVITTHNIPGLVSTADIPVTALPKGQQFVAALRAYREISPGVRLTSERSNVIGPFVVAGTPSVPTNFRRAPGS